MMDHDEIWSYSYERIQEYLLSLGADMDGDIYSLPACTVALESLPDRQLGGLSFARTRVRIEGPGSEEFYHEFRLHFLSGGA